MNWKYFLFGLVRPHIPKKVLFAITRFRGDGNIEEEAPDHCVRIWTKQLEKYRLNFVDKDVLEIGSGRYARFAVHLVAAGARRITLSDPYAVSLRRRDHLKMLLSDCEQLGLNQHNVLPKIEILPSDFTQLPEPTDHNKVDLVISYSVLEHAKDPAAVLRACWNWLKPGGSTCHIIDLRDHALRFRYPFEMLTFSDVVWTRWLDLGGGFHLNRWRAPDYIDAAHSVGFSRVQYEALERDDRSLKAILPRLHPKFRSVPTELLGLLTIALYCEKPGNVMKL